jgi:hypothetical protein
MLRYPDPKPTRVIDSFRVHQPSPSSKHTPLLAAETIDPPPVSSRPMASISPDGHDSGKNFTEEDDNILHDWIRTQERRGTVILSTDMFKLLEQVVSAA